MSWTSGDIKTVVAMVKSWIGYANTTGATSLLLNLVSIAEEYAALSVDGPVIVIDGKTVLLWDLYAAFIGTGDDAMDMWYDFEALTRSLAAREASA